MAYEMLAEQLSTFSANAELLKKEISFSHEEDAFRLACRIECIENIAEQAEFDVVVEP